MTTAGRRRGRRDNGLDAVDWRAIDDLDPRLAEDVLAMLAEQGIAAYVQPAVDVDPVTRSATVPSRPSDRLYVDRQRADAARDHLRAHLGGVPSLREDRRGDISDLDATFAGIVAGFDQPVDPTASPWPAAEEAAEATASTEPAAVGEPAPGLVDARSVTEPSLLDGLDPVGAELPERFIPPTPPPLPRLSRQTVLGWLAILVGLVLILGRPVVLPLERSTALMLGVAAIVGGAAALILRLHPGSDPDDETHPDDGAHV